MFLHGFGSPVIVFARILVHLKTFFASIFKQVLKVQPGFNQKILMPEDYKKRQAEVVMLKMNQENV